MKLNRYFFSFLLTSSVVVISGCSSLINFSFASPEIVSVGEIKEQPFSESSLKVEGKVENIVPLVNSFAYLLSDGNDQLIWVLTEDSPPEKLTSVEIEAFVKKETIVIDGKEFSEVYLQEIKRN